MQEEKFWYLLSVRLTGEATPEELEALDHLLQQHPELGLQAQLMTEMWSKQTFNRNTIPDFFDKHLQRLSNHPDVYPLLTEQPADAVNLFPDSGKVRSVYYWLLPLSGVAAAIILFFVLYTPAQIKKPSPIARNTVSTRKGSKSNVQLPDGSIAWLNADSKLTYDENFRGEYREVSLEGEAYFDVVKDKTKPFIIHTRTIDIKVLGTAFNVRAYESEKNTETALFRGSVEVTLHNSPEKKIVLKPNEKLRVNNKSLSFTSDRNEKSKSQLTAEMMLRKVHIEAKDSSAWETLWIKNKLVFDEESLEEVAQKIERWYNVSVVINGDEALKQTAYTGIFENETLLQVMEALKITGNFKFSINKDIITIR